jgi:hypothetical protein
MIKLAIVTVAMLVGSSAAPIWTCGGKTFASREALMQSGCCSHHGGVCGCSGGRKTCCDGAVSPTCRC